MAGAEEASLVQQHAQRKKAESEILQLGKLRERCPGAHDKLLVAALEEAGWELEAAWRDLREYAIAFGRQNIFEPASSAASRDKHEHNSSHKKHKRRKSGGKSDGGDVNTSKAGEHQSKLPHAVYGARGLIKMQEMDRMEGEFATWLVEQQGQNPEMLGPKETTEYKKKFVEEYNCDTLHERYRNLEAWERKHGSSCDANANVLGGLTDEEQRKREMEAERERKRKLETEQLKDVLRESNSAREDMREQQRLQEKLQLAARQGDMAEAERLRQRLQPEDLSKRYGAQQNYGFKPS